MSAHLRLVEPRNENRSVRRSRSYAVLVRPANSELRQRILIAFRHGLRASEICDLEWSQVEFCRSASLHVSGNTQLIASSALYCNTMSYSDEMPVFLVYGRADIR
jgi:hypothetical protein